MGGDRTRPGRGRFTEVPAYANGNAIGYFSFPFSTSQIGPPTPPTGTDPLRLVENGAPYSRVPAPVAYRFDGSTPCTPPKNYVYDPRTDEVRYDQQGNIVTVLPSATYPTGATPTWSYVPIVAERVVRGTIDCQSVKTETTLLSRPDLSVSQPTGNYLAWAQIDVGAGVYRIGETPGTSPGIFTQRFGWYDHFITAYIDGGYIPTTTPDNGQTVTMVPQTLFYPRSNIGTAAGAIGRGYDVLEAGRNDTGYSPVCAVMTYDAATVTATNPTACTQANCLPRDAATIRARFPAASLRPANPPYIFCFQVQ